MNSNNPKIKKNEIENYLKCIGPSSEIIYDFQKATVIEAINKYINEGKNKILVADEVGLGKTFVAKGIIKVLYELQKDSGNNSISVVYMAPNEAVLSQNVSELSDISGVDKQSQAKFSTQRPVLQFDNPNLQNKAGNNNLNGIKIYSSSPGVAFGTKSKFGDKKERLLICAILTKIFKGNSTYEGALDSLYYILYKPDFTYRNILMDIAEDYNFKQEAKDYTNWINEINKKSEYISISQNEINEFIGSFSATDAGRNIKIISTNYKHMIDFLTQYCVDFKECITGEDIVRKAFSLKKNINILNIIFSNYDSYKTDISPKNMNQFEVSIKELAFTFVMSVPFGWAYISALSKPKDCSDEINDLIKKLMKDDNLLSYFEYAFNDYSINIFSSLREALSTIIYRRIKPDLLILDEFHRYFTYEVKEGIKSILDVSANTKVLLLSATPYRMNIIGLDEDDDEYDGCINPSIEGENKNNKNNKSEEINVLKNFQDVIDYLSDNSDEGKLVSKKTKDMNDTLLKLAKLSIDNPNSQEWKDSWEASVELRNDLNNILKKYILRTERYMAYDIYNGNDTLKTTDYGNFAWQKGINAEAKIHKVLQSIVSSDALRYSKATPYLLSFAKGYNTFAPYESQGIDINKEQKKRYDVLSLKNDSKNPNSADFLFWDGFSKGEYHLRLNFLIKKVLPEGIEKLLWIPPILSNLGGCFSKLKDYTKTIVFANYIMSTKAIAAIISKTVDIASNGREQISDEEINKFTFLQEFLEKKYSYLKEITIEIDSDEENRNGIDYICNAFKCYLIDNKKTLACAGVNNLEKLNVYCKDGCLTEMFDEYFFVLKLKEDNAKTVCNDIVDSLKPSHSKIEYFSTNAYNNGLESQKDNDDKLLRVRLCKDDYIICNFVERFTDDKSDNGDHNINHFKHIQSTFNSPFLPFVLATTPMAQEGINLHYYSHSIMHWNLPVSPIEFEQREGRINRYRSHLVRKRAAELIDNEHLDWHDIFNKIELEHDELTKKNKGLFPNWYIPASESPKMERIIAYHPYSKESTRYKNLMETINLYRLSLGYGVELDKLKDIQKAIRKLNSDQYKIEDLLINLSPAFGADILGK